MLGCAQSDWCGSGMRASVWSSCLPPEKHSDTAALVGKTFQIETSLWAIDNGSDSVMSNTLTDRRPVRYKRRCIPIRLQRCTTSSPPPAPIKSLIANYVYYWYQRNNRTQAATTGENKAGQWKFNGNNTSIENGTERWNEMSSYGSAAWCALSERERKMITPSGRTRMFTAILDKFKPINGV